MRVIVPAHSSETLRSEWFAPKVVKGVGILALEHESLSFQFTLLNKDVLVVDRNSRLVSVNILIKEVFWVSCDLRKLFWVIIIISRSLLRSRVKHLFWVVCFIILIFSGVWIFVSTGRFFFIITLYLRDSFSFATAVSGLQFASLCQLWVLVPGNIGYFITGRSQR